MNINDFLQLYALHPKIDVLTQEIRRGRSEHLLVSHLSTSAISLTFAAVFQKLLTSRKDAKTQSNATTFLFILPTQDEAAYLSQDLTTLLSEKQVYYFPSAYRAKQKQHEPDPAYAIQRTEVLSQLKKQAPQPPKGGVCNDRKTPPLGGGGALIIVTYADALLDPVPSVETLQKQSYILSKGQEISQKAVIQWLMENNFQRVDFVYEPGQYSIRGGLLDIFSYSKENPYRLDFFGDEIDTIREFDIETQLSVQKVEQAEIVADTSNDTSREDAKTQSLFDYLPTSTITVSTDYALINSQLSTIHSSADRENCQLSTTIELANRSYYSSYSELKFDIVPQPIFHKNFDLLLSTLQQYADDGYRLYLLSDFQKQIDRIETILRDKLGYEDYEGYASRKDAKTLRNAKGYEDKSVLAPSNAKGLFNGAWQSVDHTLYAGFIDHDTKMLCLTDHEIFERYHKVSQKQDKARQGKAIMTLKEMNELHYGDYVVHADHGIAKFGGLVQMEMNGRQQEMLKLMYRDGGLVFVNIHSLHKVSKYRGKDNVEPKISALGSGQWERMKERTKSKVKDIARDLIQLYAQRKQEKGFQYSPDSYLQHELEASFIYEDTPDQQKATIDIKADMESSVPMDRLICGDVGFGKTELAIRAAFKAATDSKQVAVLVPTTVLALQHYQTFTERLKNFPVTIEYLSRGKTTKQTKDIIQRLKEGKIDIIIGTHKLVGKSVEYKDLGLLIIDEEQKFGVAVKEKLRQLKANVDTLTLTATPIPRTLQFSLLGARDLSIMTTPPANRYPVQTTVLTPDDEDVLAEAIRLEMNRNGQVFVVNNLVQSLGTISNKIHRLVPQARIVIAHGQMPTEEMEERLTDFINYDYDVLIATSIIESGVDIPNVNTMIIMSAHRFGLSDLHQLRGRVGRSNRKAYCYLVAPSSDLLTPEARRRLQALETFAELGSGFHIAMQDLDIRGAGNMLGAEQSGFIADLGYETYQQILNEAVLELKEEEFAQLFENEKHTDAQTLSTINYQLSTFVTDCSIDTDLPVDFPADYIENISERIALYRELDALKSEHELQEFEKRLIDRFGVLPAEAKELLQVLRLRWLCISLGIGRVVLKQDQMVLYFPNNPNSPYYQSDLFGRVITYICSNPKRCRLRQLEDTTKRSAIIGEVHSITQAIEILRTI